MAYKERKEKYNLLSQKRKRPLIVYVTSIRPGFSASMASDSISQIIEQIDAVPSQNKEIDFLIVSNGGDPITALRIMSLLRERFEKISVLLPYVAYSAATLLSLGANYIVMHPYSNLGPVDPQLTVSHNTERGTQENLQFSSEDLRNFIEFIRHDIGITDQQHLISAAMPLLKDVGSLPIGTAKRSQQLSLSLSEKMLSWHFDDKIQAQTIAKALNTSYYHHGYAVDRKEAKAIGLPVEDPDDEVTKIMWDIWKDFEQEMKCNSSFDVIKEIFADPQAYNVLSQVPILELPANISPELANTIITQCVQSMVVKTRSTIRKKILVASIESNNFAKAVYNNIDIAFWRNPDYSVGFNFSCFPTDWMEYENVE